MIVKSPIIDYVLSKKEFQEMEFDRFHDGISYCVQVDNLEDGKEILKQSWKNSKEKLRKKENTSQGKLFACEVFFSILGRGDMKFFYEYFIKIALILVS